MQIIKIEKMKNNKYKIFTQDETIITYDNVILNNDLLYKKTIDKNLYNKIIEDTNYYEIYNKTVNYILKRRRSEKEIYLYLNKYNIKDIDKKNIINKLKDINLINDTIYCEAYINDKIYLSKDGINKIRNDLESQNINLDIINKELNKIDIDIFNDRLEKIIIKKIKNNKKYSNNYLNKKILNEMVNLGYDKEKIIHILENNKKCDNNILIKEFDKNYSKLSLKYSGSELKNKLKQKLIQKGFNIDNINILLQQKTEE